MSYNTLAEELGNVHYIYDIVSYAWLYIFCVTLQYLHQPFIISPVFRRKVHSLREAIVSHHDSGL